MLLALVAVAAADDLDLEQLEISAGQSGVEVFWHLSQDDHRAIQGRTVNDPPKIMVSIANGGLKKNTLVHLGELSGTQTIDRGAWPPGLTATVTLDEWGADAFDRIVTPHGSGRSVRVPVSGGVDGADPLGAKLASPSPRPSPTPSPVSGSVLGPDVRDVSAQDVANAMVQAEAIARRLEAERRRRAELEAQRREWEARLAEQRAWLQTIASDGNHPVTRACVTAFSPGRDGKCIEIAAFRQDGAAEVTACGALPEEGHRWDCLKRVGSLNPPWSLARTVEDCVAAFPDESFACIDTLSKRVGGVPNEGFVQRCATTFEASGTQLRCLHLADRPHGVAELEACARLDDRGLRVECMDRVEEPQYLPHFIVDACVDVFGNGVEAMRCFNVAAAASTPPTQDIQACGAGFEDEESRLGCMKRFREIDWSPALAIPPCGEHFPDASIQCVHELSAGVETPPDVAIVGACAQTIGSDEDGLECIRMMRRRPGDPPAAVSACGTLFETPKDRLKCVELARRDPDGERIGACATEEKAGKRRKCVEGI